MPTLNQEMCKAAVDMRKVMADLSKIHGLIRDKEITEFMEFLNKRASQIEKDFKRL